MGLHFEECELLFVSDEYLPLLDCLRLALTLFYTTVGERWFLLCVIIVRLTGRFSANHVS